MNKFKTGDIVLYTGEFKNKLGIPFKIIKVFENDIYYDIVSISKTEKLIIESYYSVKESDLKLYEGRVLCPAVIYKDLIYPAISTLGAISLFKFSNGREQDFYEDDRGFLVSDGRFVDAHEAYIIAEYQKQLKSDVEITTRYLIEYMLIGFCQK